MLIEFSKPWRLNKVDQFVVKNRVPANLFA